MGKCENVREERWREEEREMRKGDGEQERGDMELGYVEKMKRRIQDFPKLKIIWKR